MSFDLPDQMSPLRSHPVLKSEENIRVTRSHSRNNLASSNTMDHDVGITFGMFTLSPTLRSESNHRLHRRAGAGASSSVDTAHREALSNQDAGFVINLRQELGFDVLERIEATGEAVDDAFLLKWLHARGPNIVADSIRQHATWREAFVGRHRLGVDPESIAEELAAEKIFLQGLDHHGCSVLLFLINRHVSGIAPADTTNRLLTFAIDSACAAADLRLNRERKVCCIFDMSGIKMNKNIDIAFLRGVFDLLQTHYPETLSKLYFIDAPLLFLGVWKCVTPFLQPATKAKIVFLSGAAGRRQLSEAVGPSILPPDLDGTSTEYLPVDKAVLLLRSGKSLPRAAGQQGVSSELMDDDLAPAGMFQKVAQLLLGGGGGGGTFSSSRSGRNQHAFARLILISLFILQIFFLFNKALSLVLD